jgi:ABC-type lipoprotein release transport system permease subunit
MMYAGIIAGAFLAVLVFLTVIYAFKRDKKVVTTSVTVESCVLEVVDKSDKIKVEALEREVFKKADKVKQMASQRTKTAVMKAPVRIVGSSFVPTSIERVSDTDPLNESSVSKTISNKVEHVKRLSQDF